MLDKTKNISESVASAVSVQRAVGSQANLGGGRRSPGPLTIGSCATLACLLEVTAAKPGNVYRGADFEDLTYLDFLVSATVIGPVMERAAVERAGRRVGETVLAAGEATRSAVGTNTNLGTLLLLAPLSAVPRQTSLSSGITSVLSGLDEEDAHRVYEAIRRAAPGGMGTSPKADVAYEPTTSLVEAMRLAESRDLVARQYVNAFADVLQRIVPWLTEALSRDWSLSDAIVWTHVRQMSEVPDSLIARKCGLEIAEQASVRAAGLLATGGPGEAAYEHGLADFDFWLRSDGHRRNPGTTADLICAGLFAALREGLIDWPLSFYNKRNRGGEPSRV